MSNNLVEFPDDYYHYDKAHLIEQYGNISTDILDSYRLAEKLELDPIKEKVDHIYFLGLGGSAIGGDLIKLYLEEKGFSIPITTVRDYDIPKSMTKKSLVFAVSYSGNTEETISTYRQALRVTKHCIALSSGGKLQEITKVNRYPHLLIPKNFQPRTAALSYLFFPFLKMLEKLKVINSVEADVEHLVQAVLKPDFKAHAIDISEKLHHKVPIIYATTRFLPLAYRFKTQINENAKVHAFCHTYSEFNHNEILGYENMLTDYHVVSFRFDEDHRRIHKRMDILKSMFNARNIGNTEVKMTGDHFLTKIYSSILLGDLISYYLALRYRVDPSPVEIIEDLKEKMGPFI